MLFATAINSNWLIPAPALARTLSRHAYYLSVMLSDRGSHVQVLRLTPLQVLQ